MIWREFKAMGTDIVITADLTAEQENILVKAENIIIDFEKRFSRFIENNELFKFNSSSELTQELSETFIALLMEIEKYHYKTKGIFDPTIIESLEAVGYNRSFEKISPDFNNSNIKELQEKFIVRPKIDQIKLTGKKARKPLNLKIDLGGIGKGYIVDFIGRILFSNIKNYWISAGGDILASGKQDNYQGWDIVIQNPLEPEADAFTINTHGEKIGIATSGIIKRQGVSGNFKWHHIIDPRTGLPADNNILSVTVISSSAIKADIFAKTVLILGEIDGLNFIEKEEDCAVIIFTKANSPILSSRSRLYLNDLNN